MKSEVHDVGDSQSELSVPRPALYPPQKGSFSGRKSRRGTDIVPPFFRRDRAKGAESPLFSFFFKLNFT